MSWKYEATNLERVYDLINDKHPDIKLLQEIAQKAYKVAIEFDKVITDEFVSQYLNDDLLMNAISTLSLKASVLYPFKYPKKFVDIDGYMHNSMEEDMDIDDTEEMFSYSHSGWLRKLTEVKGKWFWNADNQSEAFQNIMDEYITLQVIALSYPTKFP